MPSNGRYRDDPDWIDPETVTHAQIRAVETAYWPLFQKTRHRADMSRKLTTGQLEASIPQEFVDAVDSVDPFRVDTPFKYTEPLSIKQALSKVRAEVKREPSGIGPRAMTNATRIEQGISAVMDRTEGGFRWDALIDLELMEGAAAHITMPVPADPLGWPLMMDEDGNLKPRYKIDAKGRRDGDADYEGLSLGTGSELYRKDVDRWLRDHPLVDYYPVSILDCAPIIGRRGLRGLLTREVYTESELFEDGFFWDEQAGFLTPLGSPDASFGASGGLPGAVTDIAGGAPGAQRILYGLWVYDKRTQCPIVAYCVGGKGGYYRTWREDDDGEEKAAIINLKKRFGMRRLPISFQYGQSWFTTDPDLRSMPYTSAFHRGWLAVDQMFTVDLIHHYRFGMSGLIEQIDNPDLARVILEKNVPIDLNIRPMGVARVFGKVGPSVPAPSSSGMSEKAAMLLGLTEQTTDSDVTGASAETGFGKTVAAAYARDARYQVSEAVRRHHEASASFTAEILTGMARKMERSIPIAGNFAVPIAAEGGQSSTRDVLEWTETLCGDDFTVTSEFAKEFGDNLALQQQAAEFVDRGLKPRRWFHEFTGERSPEVVEAEILSDKMLASEQGIADTFALVAKIQGERDKAAVLELQASGEVGPDGLPSGLMDEMQGMGQPALPPGQPAPQGGSMTGIGSPGGAMLGSEVSAGMMSGPAANVGQAGVPMAPGIQAPGM